MAVRDRTATEGPATTILASSASSATSENPSIGCADSISSAASVGSPSPLSSSTHPSDHDRTALTAPGSGVPAALDGFTVGQSASPQVGSTILAPGGANDWAAVGGGCPQGGMNDAGPDSSRRDDSSKRNGQQSPGQGGPREKDCTPETGAEEEEEQHRRLPTEVGPRRDPCTSGQDPSLEGSVSPPPPRH